MAPSRIFTTAQLVRVRACPSRFLVIMNFIVALRRNPEPLTRKLKDIRTLDVHLYSVFALVLKESTQEQDNGQHFSNNPTDPVTHLYNIASSNPQIWRSSSCQFKRAASLILVQIDNDERDSRRVDQKPISLDSMYPYLMSVAIENLLKGILIGHQVPFEKVVSFDHNLVELYNECNRSCGLTATKEERRVLGVLRQFDTWAGRFNLPKKREDLSDAVKKHGINLEYGLIITPLLSGSPSKESLSVPSERKKIDALYQRVLSHLEGIIAASDNPNLFPCE